MQLNPFDDFPFHQALSPIDVPATSDSHFNDGYYFAFYRPGLHVFMGLRLHPNSNVMDGYAGAVVASRAARRPLLAGAAAGDERARRGAVPARDRRADERAARAARRSGARPRVRRQPPGQRARVLRDPPPAGAARARLQRRAPLHPGLPGERRADDRRRARAGRRLVRLPRPFVGNPLDDGAVRPDRRPREGDGRPPRAAALGAVRMRRRRSGSSTATRRTTAACSTARAGSTGPGSRRSGSMRCKHALRYEAGDAPARGRRPDARRRGAARSTSTASRSPAHRPTRRATATRADGRTVASQASSAGSR